MYPRIELTLYLQIGEHQIKHQGHIVDMVAAAVSNALHVRSVSVSTAVVNILFSLLQSMVLLLCHTVLCLALCSSISTTDVFHTSSSPFAECIVLASPTIQTFIEIEFPASLSGERSCWVQNVHTSHPSELEVYAGH